MLEFFVNVRHGVFKFIPKGKGVAMIKLELFTQEKHNVKLAKSRSSPYQVIGLFLSPHKANSLGVNLCPHASPSCIASCLNTAGHAQVFPQILRARIRKSNQFLEDRPAFIARLKEEIVVYKRRAEKNGRKLVVRLNGTSDITFERYDIMGAFPTTQFYDYTKDHRRMSKYLGGNLPANYHLTFSYSGENLTECRSVLKAGGNVAAVFSSDKFPSHWQGYKVVSGEKSDLRFLDPSGVVVGLRAKGQAEKKEIAGSFVIQIDKKRG